MIGKLTIKVLEVMRNIFVLKQFKRAIMKIFKKSIIYWSNVQSLNKTVRLRK